MSEQTKIEWADSTVNFWSGCTKVSAGCAHCYAETLSNRKLGNIGQWGKGAPRKRHQSAFKLAHQLNAKPWICDDCGAAYPVGQVQFDDDCNCQPRAYRGATKYHRRRVFSLSLGDWLDPEVPIEWLAEMLDTIRQCEQVQWLLVTKRPEFFRTRLLEALAHVEKVTGDWPDREPDTELGRWIDAWQCGEQIPKHIMVLTSVEDQKAADERIPALLKIPAAQRGLSCEPLLGPVDLTGWRTDIPSAIHETWAEALDWVIIGGESGPGARVCNVDWIRSLVNQCQSAGVAAFVKQLGASPYLQTEHQKTQGVLHSKNGLDIRDKKGGKIAEWPADLRVRQFPEAL